MGSAEAAASGSGRRARIVADDRDDQVARRADGAEVHRVRFAGGESHTMHLGREGSFRLDLPWPSSAGRIDGHGTVIAGLTLRVSAMIGTRRLLPAISEPPSGPGTLVEPGRRVHLRLPDDVCSSAAAVAGVCVAVRGGPSGGHAVGRLLTDVDGRPGSPIDGGVLLGTNVVADSQTHWLRLPTATNVGLEARWIELTASAGTFAVIGAVDAETQSTTTGSPIRVFAVSDPTRPLPALMLGLSEPTVDLVPSTSTWLTPNRHGTSVSLTASRSMAPRDGALPVFGANAASGTYTIRDVDLHVRVSGARRLTIVN